MSATLLSSWNATVQAAPAATALIDAANARVYSRGELDALADAWHTQHGAELAGATVLFAEPNGPEWLRVFLGLLKAGAVIVPLDSGEPPAAQQAIAIAIDAAWRWGEGKLHAVVTPAPRRPPRDGRRLVKLTSGSTGTPRAIAFTDAQMIADGRQVCAGMEIRADDANFGLIPFGHSYGLGNLVLPLLTQGTAIVGGATALPHAIAETIARWKPTLFPAVPALLGALARSDVPATQLASLRTVISAGAPLAPEIAEAFHTRFGRSVHSFYGSTETGGITFDRTGEAARTGRSVGTPLPGVRLGFARGGRFTVESGAVFTIGNRRRAENGFGRHLPADIAELNAGGELVLRGRAGRTVKIAGRRLDLAEVERALKALAGVHDALVMLHAERADALAAVVATARSVDELRAELREKIAGWKIPKKLVTLSAFPLTARGKTDTAKLRALLGART